MRIQYCTVCKANIGLYGWASHVAKEKRLHGENIYLITKIKNQQEKPNKETTNIISKFTLNKSLLDYEEFNAK